MSGLKRGRTPRSNVYAAPCCEAADRLAAEPMRRIFRVNVRY